MVGWLFCWIDLGVECLSFSILRAIKICGSPETTPIVSHFWVSRNRFPSFWMISFKSEISMITACLLYQLKSWRNVQECLLQCLLYFVRSIVWCWVIASLCHLPCHVDAASGCMILHARMNLKKEVVAAFALACLWKNQPEWHGKDI